MAVAAGYEVITTASPKNFGLVKRLGATQVFDYNSGNIVDDLATACKGKVIVGLLDCIGPPATALCMELMQKIEGNRVVITTKPEPKAQDIPEGVSIHK